MTVDEIGRAAGTRLRERTATDIDASRSLDALVRRMRRRRQLRAGGTVLVAAAAAVAVALTLRSDFMRNSQPALPHPTTPTSVSRPLTNNPCVYSFVDCLNDRVRGVAMEFPISWQLPGNVTLDIGSFTWSRDRSRALSVELYRQDTADATGVSIFENVRAARLTRETTVDHTVAPDARHLAQWLADRPDLVSSRVSSGTVGGLRSWTVDVRLAEPRTRGIGRCFAEGMSCTPILAVGQRSEPLAQGLVYPMASRYTFLDIPGHHTAAIWSWTLGRPSLLDGNERFIDSIRFETSGSP